MLGIVIMATLTVISQAPVAAETPSNINRTICEYQQRNINFPNSFEAAQALSGCVSQQDSTITYEEARDYCTIVSGGVDCVVDNMTAAITQQQCEELGRTYVPPDFGSTGGCVVGAASNSTPSGGTSTGGGGGVISSNAEAGTTSEEDAVPATEGLPLGADEPESQACEGGGDDCDINNLSLVRRLNWLVNFLALIVLPIITIMMVIAGIQYSSSQGNPQGQQAAKNKLKNLVVSVVAFIFIWTLLEWLIPGGIIG